MDTAMRWCDVSMVDSCVVSGELIGHTVQDRDGSQVGIPVVWASSLALDQ